MNVGAYIILTLNFLKSFYLINKLNYVQYMKLQLSEEVQQFLKNEYPNADIDNMSLEELEIFKEEISNKRQEYALLENAQKT